MEKPYTIFYDMSSGGTEKEPFSILAVRMPISQAVWWFEQTYGHNPFYITCECCGEDYSVYEAATPCDADLVIESPTQPPQQ